MSFGPGAPGQAAPTWEMGPTGATDSIFGIRIGADGTITLPGGGRFPNFPSRPTGGTGPGGFPGGTVPINPDRSTPTDQIGSGGFIQPGNDARDPRPGDFNGVGQVGSVGSPDSNQIQQIYQRAWELLRGINLGGLLKPGGDTQLPGATPTPGTPRDPSVGAPGLPGIPSPSPSTPGSPPQSGDLDSPPRDGGFSFPDFSNARYPRADDPGFTQPAPGGDDVATDGLNFGIGRPNEQNQFNASISSGSNTLFQPQADLIGGMLPGLGDMANQQSQQIGQYAPGMAGQLQGQGQQFLGQLGQGQNPYLQQLAQFQGGQGQDVFGQLASGNSQIQQQLMQGGGNQFIDSAIDSMGEDINRQLQRQNVGIGQQATQSGARGGSRQGVAEGIANEAAINQFGSASSGMRAADAAQQAMLRQQGLGQALQGQIAGGQGQQGGSQMQMQGLLGASGGQGNLNTTNQGGAQAGLGQLQNQFNLGLAPQASQWMPYQNLAGLWDPINQAQSRTESSGESSGGGGFNFNLGGL